MLGQFLPEVLTLHVYDVGLVGKSDAEVLKYALAHDAITVTFDEDLADQRLFPVGSHAGVVRLRVEPTDVATTWAALFRLFNHVELPEIRHALVIVDSTRIRIVQAPSLP